MLSLIKLDNFDLGSLLNGTVVFSETDKAIATSIGEMLAYAYRKKTLIDPNVDKSEWLLDIIAVEEDVDLYDTSFPIETKRAMIKNSSYLKARKGTPGAIELAISTIFEECRVYEWWEYGGQPYHFYVEVLVSASGITVEEQNLLDKLIALYKNQRSILDEIKVFMKTTSDVRYVTILQGGEILTVYPWYPFDIETTVQASLGTNMHTVEELTVYPE